MGEKSEFVNPESWTVAPVTFADSAVKRSFRLLFGGSKAEWCKSSFVPWNEMLLGFDVGSVVFGFEINRVPDLFCKF